MNKCKKISISVILSLGLLIFFPTSFAKAQFPMSPETDPLGKGGCSSTQIYTALGCIDISSSNDIILFIVRWGIGLGGGVAFLMIIYGSYLVMISRGDPKKLAAGQETVTSAIMGLIMLIFCITILELIGVKILAIPGFGI